MARITPTSDSSSNAASLSVPVLNELGQEVYPMDSSWSMTSRTLNNKMGKGIKQELYDNYIEGCKEAARNTEGIEEYNSCVEAETTRIHMNTNQPRGMRNYTQQGFAKIRTPEKLRLAIAEFWAQNKDKAEIEWKSVNTYHNMWEAPPTLVNVQDPTHFSGAGLGLQTLIWETAKDVAQEWTGMHLAPCSMWGIRIYHNNSILAPHVDRNPLVTSAIINVDQDVDEPWPLEVWGHDGKPYNITMAPGDMVLYESHSIVHGRPFPFRGRYYANVFVHFEPLGPLKLQDLTDTNFEIRAEEQESLNHGLPPYVIPGSDWEEEWHQSNPDGWQLLHDNAQMAASRGQLDTLVDLKIQNPSKLHQADNNGWYPIHEAARNGHVHVVSYLLENGDADINAVTNHGKGYSVLKVAQEYLEEGHPMMEFLQSRNAQLIEPEL
eukprot:CAMPEP_0194033644 /NCGR_PEP_ID=MMETSP0009_2-20130614/6250_1 /TAXON_ID=210454 /ORGANISM="Grammatophora oceanica, Strain CCMP 410" /LENGTH=434 /DNA_ID=CAMNT_0038674359 /DNA_START=204 /DNA_END=1508 /DNA_ORIENTATION=-